MIISLISRLTSFCINMALLRHLLSVVLVTATFVGNRADVALDNTKIQIPHRVLPELLHTRYGKVDDIPNIDYGKIDAELFRKIAESEGKNLDLASKHGDIRDWLILKARENRESRVIGSNDGFDTTPIGNISQKCYNDLMRYYTDLEGLQPYATRSKFGKGKHNAKF